jgi:hypothetical protein
MLPSRPRPTFAVPPVDVVAASLFGAEVAVVVEAVANVAPRLAGEGLASGSGSRREGERQGEDADHRPAAGRMITSE